MNFFRYICIKKTAFTLAEVLITLGIIGVVAAMTIPNLMTAFAKHRVETQLVKFYATMNQAIRMSVADDNGTPEGWIIANKAYTYDEALEVFKTYISPYLKHDDYKTCIRNSKQNVCVNLINGGLLTFKIDANGADIVYYLDGDIENHSPKNSFWFQFAKLVSYEDTSLNSQNFIEPYIFDFDGTREDLKTHSSRGCYKKCSYCNYCTKLIQLNSWKIPSDYPW